MKITASFVAISERNRIVIASLATIDHDMKNNELCGVLQSVQNCLKAAVG